MSQTNNTPAGPERGSIATGQHTPERDGDSAAGNGRGVDTGEKGAVPVDEPSPTTASDEGATVTGADIVASEAPPAEREEVREPDATATTKIRIPASAQSAPADEGDQDAEPAAPTLDPLPAPAVPAPGPAAAQPPPWRRMPGHEIREEPVATDAAGLLDDGPTAFLEAPRFTQPPGSRNGETAAGETGGWARATTRSRPPRQAALQLRRLDPWSVLKLALVLAVVLFFIWLVAVGVLYGVLDGMGVWDRLNGTYADLVSGEAQTGSALISAGRVFGLAAVIGAINSLLFAVAVTVGAFVYNVSADLVGGIEVTLSERD